MAEGIGRRRAGLMDPAGYDWYTDHAEAALDALIDAGWTLVHGTPAP
ncbi:MAG: hypothetical protein ACYDAD_11660 [Acidimicrobiales bacterium]